MAKPARFQGSVPCVAFQHTDNTDSIVTAANNGGHPPFVVESMYTNAMSIRILNCGTIRPFLLPFPTGVTCLLIETNDGIALVDTGFGTADYLRPNWQMRLFLGAIRSPRALEETALQRVQRAGYRPQEVRHVIMTHLHIDHAGGLPDFPWAQVHLSQPEYDYSTGPRVGWEYHPMHWAHGPRWVPHALQTDKWYDFDAVRIPSLEPETWIVPLMGHTPGHSGVAVRQGAGWILHAGDAVPYNMRVEDVPDRVSRLLIGPHVPRLRQFMHDHPEVQIIGSHMSPEFYLRFQEASHVDDHASLGKPRM